jgi:hypothetical protein
MIQITSISPPFPDMDSRDIVGEGVSKEAEREYIHKARYIEKLYSLYNYRTYIRGLNIGEYFVKFRLMIAVGVKVDDLLELGSNLKVALKTPYLKFYVPSSYRGNLGIDIEIPNTCTKDELVRKEINKLTHPDFLFLKIYTMLISSRSINPLYISEELNISESRVKKYLRDMKELNIISKDGLFVEETNIYKGGYYWNRWRNCSLQHL